MLIQIDRNPSRIKLHQFSITLVLLSAWLIFRYWSDSELRAPASVGTLVHPGLWILFGLGTSGLVFPKIARVAFITMSYLTFPIGIVVSYIVLFTVYYLMIAPTGICMRWMGRDRLALRNWKDPKSRWTRRKPATDLTYYLRQ